MSYYSDLIAAAAPALYWPLDSSAGATDLSGNGRNGTVGGVMTLGAYGGSPLYGGSYSTDWGNAYISSTYDPYVNATTRTFEGWANRDNSSTYHMLAAGTGSSTPRMYLQSGSQDVTWQPDQTAGVTTWSNAWPGNGLWVYWALVFNESADTAALYINGALVSSQACTTQYSPGNFQLGDYSTGNQNPFDGKMAHAAIYERGLTAAEIAIHYRAGVQGQRRTKYAQRVLADAPSLYWALDTTTGATDLSGNGYNGTAQGGVTVGGNTTTPLADGTNTTDFDGSNDYISSSYTTRRNLVFNPSAETDMTYILANGASTVTRSTAQAYAGSASVQVALPGTNYYDGVFFGGSGLGAYIPATVGTTYTAAAYFRWPGSLPANLTAQVGINFHTSAGAYITSLGYAVTAVTDTNWHRLTGNSSPAPAVAPATTAYATVYVAFYISPTTDYSGTATTGTAYVDGAILEAASSAGAYFDGSGYVNAASSWVPTAGVQSGWLGTAHASASDKGCFANGTSRTFSWWANQDVLTDNKCIMGCANGRVALQYNATSGTFSLWTDVSGPTGPNTTFTVAQATSAWNHWACVFNEPADRALLYKNGALVQTNTYAGQWGSTGGNPTDLDVFFGTYQAGGQAFDGKLSNWAIHERALSADEVYEYYQAGLDSFDVGQIRQLPPLRLSVNVQPPSGQPTRWARDERRPENVASGINFSTTAPGGFESFSCTLPRRPETSYSDLERLSNVVVRGVGGMAWEGRLESSPRVSGTQMAVSPSAVGWQAHLEDDKSASMVYVDRDMGNWRGMSRARQIALLGATVNVGDGSLSFDTSAGIPAIEMHIQAPQPALAGINVEQWYDAGVGNLISSVYWDRTSNADVAGQPNSTFVWEMGACSDDGTLAGLQLTADQQTGTGSAETGTFTPTTGLRFAFLLWQQSTLAGTNNYYSYVRRLAVWGNHGLSKRGTAPDDGLYASDVIAHAVRQWAPKLRATTGAAGTIQPTTFIVPHLAFNDRTTAAEIVSSANRFQINDWMVWEGPMDGQPTFYLYPRGSRGRAWRARVGPSQLSEAGPSMERLWNGVIVRYSDVDGTSKTVGPTNSGCDTTSVYCTDTDPLNPANKAGIRRWTILEMQGVSTPAGATEVGKRFLEQTRLLDTSGQATITGYVEDDRGTKRPAWQMRAGDTIQFVDAADTSSRRIVKTSYSADNATCSLGLDAPPDGLADLLERLQVVLVPLGL